MAWEDRAYHRDPDHTGPRVIFPMPSKLTFALILSCVILFFVERVTGSFGRQVGSYGVLSFVDALGVKQPWRWITYQYLHGSGMHLFINILFIYFFVPPLERMWGWKLTLGFYTVGGVAAGATYGLMNLFVPSVGIVGASGCVFAVLGALTAIMPNMQVLAMLVIPITMRTLTLLYTVLFVFTVIGDRDPSDAAHLGGLAFGFLAARYGGGVLGLLRHRVGDEEPADYGGAYEPHHRARRRSRWAAKRALKLARAEREERRRIDDILAKVSAHGMHSLSWWERRVLRKATERQRQRDEEFSRLQRR